MNDIKLAEEKAAIENCEKDVLHDTAWIQPFGYMLACDSKEWTITHASENITQCFGVAIDNIIGAPLNTILDATIVHQCKNAAAHSTITTQREYIGYYSKAAQCYTIFAHKKRQYIILELQATDEPKPVGLSMLDSVQRILERLSKHQSPQELMAAAVGELRAITRFHRVKTYRFLTDGAGEVIAESREAQVESFLGLRFPAQDVPQAARVLYASTPIRMIPAVDAEQVPIIRAEGQAPLDVSLALLRGVVPVHVLYLQNMGVKATLSLPIIVDGKMWGLFACHHMQTYILSPEVICALEILGSSTSMMLATILQRRQLKRIEQCTRLVNTLFVPDKSLLGFSAYWGAASPELAKLLDCDGIALLGEKQLDQYGLCPPIDAIKQLADALDSHYEQTHQDTAPIALDSIRASFPHIHCDTIAGVLAIPEPAVSYRYLLFFRKDASKTVRWAGAPKKDIQYSAQGIRLTPRASFAEYIDATQKRSDPFDDEHIITAGALKEALVNTMFTVSSHSQHRERLGLVIRELNHRVRNILSLVDSIVSQSKQSSHDLDSFVTTLELRIQALSETHKLLTEFDWEPIHIRLLFEKALAPYEGYMRRHIQLLGADISIPPELASLLALVVHELASNAAKYGALSNPVGHITLSWQTDADKLVLQWQERGGKPVQQPTHQGFGTTLIKEALAYELDAICNLNFLPQGVEADFIIPYKNINMIEEPVSEVANIHVKTIKPFSAMVLEDDYIIAKETKRLLKSIGASEVDTAPTIERAKTCIANKQYDFVLLDANIRGTFSGEVATMLAEQSIPFAFATGYGSKDQQLQTTACIDILTKPIDVTQLLAVLNQIEALQP